MNFLDTNVIVRFILADDPKLSPKAKAIFEKIDKGEKVFVTSVIIAEAVYVLLKVYKLAKTEIKEKLLPIVLKESILTENKDLLNEVFETFVIKNVDFEDAFQNHLMKKKRISKIYSFDEDFDKFSHIQRLEG